MFESLVNTEGFKTTERACAGSERFESLVNTEGFKTTYRIIRKCFGLRVLLIQKNLKHAMSKAEYWQRLRGLLIQKM